MQASFGFWKSWKVGEHVPCYIPWLCHGYWFQRTYFNLYSRNHWENRVHLWNFYIMRIYWNLTSALSEGWLYFDVYWVFAQVSWTPRLWNITHNRSKWKNLQCYSADMAYALLHLLTSSHDGEASQRVVESRIRVGVGLHYYHRGVGYCLMRIGHIIWLGLLNLFDCGFL